ncbi:MAG: aldo/keto reductase, partial [Victivallales bacterium]
MSGIKTITWRNEKVSSLVLGTVQLGLDYGIANSGGKPSDKQALELIDATWTGGIDFFDTAQAYGDSEAVLGRALNTLKIADSAKLISKISPALSSRDYPAISASVEESLGKLGISQLWGLMLHRSEWLEEWDGGLGITLENLRKDGKVKHIGVSVYTPEEAKRALGTDGVDIIQVPCSAWDQRMINSGVFS